ncbi:MAG: hypothetical protein M3R06_08195, partial [Chloroflexota bacterium]|nr:hypothetical protein [Chloroflexota bacterium]
MPDRFDVLDDDFNDTFDPYGPKQHTLRSSLLGRTANRRAVLAGLGAVLVGAIAAGAAQMRGLFGQDDPTPRAAPSTVSPTATSTPKLTPTVTASARLATPTVVAPTAAPAATAALMTDGVVPSGMALVTSPRLPLFGIGATQVGPLLAGKVADWRALGAAVETAVTPLALTGLVPAGMSPVETFA